MNKWLFLVVLSLAAPVWANDSAVSGVGGRWKRLDKEHSSVRMVSETVDIWIRGRGFYNVEANFVFQNDGKSQIVEMGFPESAAGDVGETEFRRQTGFSNFKTWIDGVSAPVVRRVLSTSQDEEEFAALWVKKVPFRSGQTRSVKVAYRSNFGITAGAPFTWWVNYDFTGGNWKGNVALSRLTVHFERPGTFLVAKNKELATTGFVRKGHDFIFEWKNWQAEENFKFLFASTLRGWVDENPDDILKGNWPINIDLPRRSADETKVDWLPAGAWRDGQLFVSLRHWLDFAGKKRKFQQIYDAKTQSAMIESEGKTASFQAGKDGAFRAGGLFGSDPILFVPASVLGKTFGAGFQLDAKAHKLEFLN